MPSIPPSCPKLPSAPSPACSSSLSHWASYGQQTQASQHPATTSRALLLLHAPSSRPHCHTVIDKNKHSVVTCHRNENCSGGRNWEHFVLLGHKRFKLFSLLEVSFTLGGNNNKIKTCGMDCAIKGNKCCRPKLLGAKKKGEEGHEAAMKKKLSPCARGCWALGDAGGGGQGPPSCRLLQMSLCLQPCLPVPGNTAPHASAHPTKRWAQLCHCHLARDNCP